MMHLLISKSIIFVQHQVSNGNTGLWNNGYAKLRFVINNSIYVFAFSKQIFYEYFMNLSDFRQPQNLMYNRNMIDTYIWN